MEPGGGLMVYVRVRPRSQKGLGIAFLWALLYKFQSVTNRVGRGDQQLLAQVGTLHSIP